MGEALSAESRHGSVDYMSDEPWIELEEARARSSNPTAVSLRYHREEVSSLADVYQESGTVLGQGVSGEVLLAWGRHDGQKYALKRFNKRTMKAQSLKLLKREVEVYLSVDHPGIARLCDVYECPDSLTLVMECCTGGELFERLLEQERCCLPEPEAAVALQQMLHAVKYLHAHSVVHRDLKLENFLYESAEADAPLKLIDFGFAKVWQPDMPLMHTCCGSIAYVSPDVLQRDGYTNKCDMWSLGVIAFMLLAGYAPFSGAPRLMKQMIKAGDIDWGCQGKWHGVSQEACSFVRSLLTRDPEQRLDASSALAHPWLIRMVPRPSAQPSLQPEVLASMRQYALAPRLRQLALQLVARELPPEETLELRRLFLALDADKTGTVCLSELEAAFRRQRVAGASESIWSYFSLWPSAPATSEAAGRLLPAPASSGDAARREAAEVFHALDCNGDGEAYASDFFAAALGALPRPRAAALRRVFARLDADGSGAVGAADLQRALGGQPEAAEALLAASGAALDGQGELGFAAFSQLLLGGGPPAPLPSRM